MTRISDTVRLASFLSLLLIVTGCGDTASEPDVAEAEKPDTVRQDSEAEIQRAKAAISEFATELKSELISAMQQGGPLNAIEVCNRRAIVIRDRVSENQDLRLSRVSLRNRNPDNLPLSWQRPVLQSFDELQKAGVDPNEMDWSEIASVDGREQFRYMKAIPTAGMCLQCHGQNIAPEVKEVLSDLYPNDKATGFSEGEIRGAFVVVTD